MEEGTGQEEEQEVRRSTLTIEAVIFNKRMRVDLKTKPMIYDGFNKLLLLLYFNDDDDGKKKKKATTQIILYREFIEDKHVI